ncbi:ABC transporter ATP-binding protein/permease [Ruminococcaceae bacterium OttesenSCG-928-A16]|nr:ABC transporter ATP-binding protein/permease [Ruminococcaceae bacterium OttesenSCG-928-A16]
MKLIAQNFKGHYREIILGPLFKLLEAILELLVPLVMANIIDVGIRNGDAAYVVKNGVIMLVLAVLGAASAMVCQYFAAVAAGHFGRRLRKQVYHHVLSLSQAQLEEFGAGGLITRLTNDTNQIQNGVNMAIRLGSRIPFLAVGSIVMSFIINWKIGLVFLLSTPFIVLVLYLIMKRTVPRYSEIQQNQDILSRLSGENLEGTRVIRAFSRQQQEQEDFEKAGDAMSNITVRVGKISAALNPITTLIVNLAIVAIVWLGARLAFNAASQPGQIIALVNYMNQTLLALIMAANLTVLFTRALASTKRVAQVLQTQPSIVNGPGATEVTGAPAIAFNQVSFAYHQGGEAVLEDISFTVAQGQTVGIIGGTGSGKTTLAALIARNYDVTSGEVLVNGVSVKQYALHVLRAKIGMVPQKAALFSGSVRRNLTLGAPTATDEEIWQALQTAQGADFVKNLPGGLDAIIEEGGKNLSGGQKQRLTIARALVRRPQILILDDSSSALDYATDAALRRALKEDTQTMTTIMISQRAASIKNADLILVLDDGKLAGMGKHRQLLQTSSVYHEICASQGMAEPEVTP